MRRHLSWIFAGSLLLGGLAACSDDDDDDDGGTDTEQDSGDDSGDSGDSGDSESGNADVQAYCDDVEELASELEGVSDAGGLADLQDELNALNESGTELSTNAADLTPEDSEAIAACSQTLAEASATAASNIGN